MKKLLTLLVAIAVLTGLSFAQSATSDVYGTVVLPDGSAIPGVAVTLTGDVIGKKIAVTSEQGNFRFLKLPPGIYELKFELEGFKTVVQKGIRLFVGKNKTFNVQMETSKLKEVIEVKGKAGTIDTRKTTVGVNVTKEMIQSLPTARNPWTVLNLVPGMMVDREDVGGNESGQQSSFYGHGADSEDTTWNVDGANITDPSAIGAAPTYLNINSYEELQVTLGNNDITAQTGGTQLNFVSKRAGNKYAGDFHLYVEDEAWEMDQTLPQEMIDAGLQSPGIFRLYQYGVNFGGPVIKDKLWFFGSWGVQDIHSKTIAQSEDATWLVSGYGKINFQLGNTSGDFHYSYDAKKKWGRTALGAANQDPATAWNQDGPGAVITGSLQQVMGNLMLNAKFAYTDGGFTLMAGSGSDNYVDDATGNLLGSDSILYGWWEYYSGGIPDYYSTNRDTLNLSLSGNYFMENVMGGDHEIKFGVDYYTGTTTSTDLYPNQRTLWVYDKNNPDLYKEIWWKPNTFIDVGFKRISFYLSDTITFGKLTANIGLRYDKEQGSHNEITNPGLTFNGTPIFTNYLPAITVPAKTIDAAYETISPRLSLTYDISGNGKNVVKVSAARYGSQSGNSLANFMGKVGWREIDVYWADDGDNIVEAGEFSDDPSWWTWWNIDTANPGSTLSSNRFSPDFNSPLLDEFTVSFEKGLGDDIAVSITGFYKKKHKLVHTVGIMADGSVESKDNWYYAGDHTFSDGTTAPVYYRYEAPVAKYRSNFNDAYNTYLATQLTFTKRFADKWMLNASFTYSDWTASKSKSETYDLLNFDYYDGGVVAPESGGSGVRGIFVNSRWMFKVSGLYQLPFGVNITGVFTAREGYVLPYYEVISRPIGLGNSAIYESGKNFGDDRLPTFWMLNLGIEKTFKVSDKVTTTLFVDGYNITNNATTLKVETRLGRTTTDNVLRVLNPGIFQFGIRVNF